MLSNHPSITRQGKIRLDYRRETFFCLRIGTDSPREATLPAPERWGSVGRRRTRSKTFSTPARGGTFWRGRRSSPRNRRKVQTFVLALILLGVATLAAWGAYRLLTTRTSARPPAPVVRTQVPVQKATPQPPMPAPQAPAGLQKALEKIAGSYGEPVGIAVSDVRTRWVAQVAPDRAFPQQSVSKTWVALAVMDAIDRGQLTLDSPILMVKADRSVFNQPLGRAIKDEGFQTTVANLLRHALIESDNSANDTLIRLIGLDAVRETLERKGIAGIKMGADERHLQALVAGLTWDPAYSEGRNFENARVKLSPQARQAALQAYLADPIDGASPAAIARALASLKRGDLLSPASTQFMLDVLGRVRTGPNRLKGGLSSGWSLAHKTGTGQELKGLSIGINDVGLMTAPDGHAYAVAVMIAQTRQPVQNRLAMMHAVTAAVTATWEGKTPSGEIQAAPKTLARPRVRAKKH